MNSLQLISDVVFKTFFSKDDGVDFLKEFIKQTLGWGDDRVQDIKILNPNIPKERIKDKDSILDILVKSERGEQVHIEIQVADHIAFCERIVYYNSRLITSQLEKGEDYSSLKKTVSIVITDFNIFKNLRHKEKYHRIFQLSDGDVIFSDIVELHTVELPNLPQNINNEPDFWFELFRAKTDDDLKNIAKKSVLMSKAVKRLNFISADEELRQQVQEREDARRVGVLTIKLAEKNAKKEKQIEIAKIMIADNEPVARIVKYTKLSEVEINDLKKSSGL